MHGEERELVWEGKELRIYRERVAVGNQVLLLEQVVRVDGTRILALNNEQQLLLTNEYRRELGRRDWRLPGGRLDSDEEPPLLAAKRELKEETGYTAELWTYLWSSVPHSSVRYQRHFYLACGLKLGETYREASEDISVHWVSFEEGIQMALDGWVSEEISALSILRLAYARPQNGLTRILGMHTP